MEKSSFELRTELLKQAQEIASATYYKDLSKADSLHNYYISKDDIPNAKKVEYPIAPTVREILEIACQLNNFSSCSNPTAKYVMGK